MAASCAGPAIRVAPGLIDPRPKAADAAIKEAPSIDLAPSLAPNARYVVRHLTQRVMIGKPSMQLDKLISVNERLIGNVYANSGAANWLSLLLRYSFASCQLGWKIMIRPDKENETTNWDA